MIRINIVFKEFSTGKRRVAVLKNIDLSIQEGSFWGVYGPNGCGKTTLLEIIAGLDKDFQGEIVLGGATESVGFMFQNYKESLFPWMDNLDNISYFSLLRGASKKERADTVRAFLDKYDLNVDLKAYPYQQSGGQQQLVSLLRAMIYTPRLLIMDEPFSSLDQYTRFRMSRIIQKYWEESKTTILFISHDLDESLLLSETIAVMRKISARKNQSILEVLKVDFPQPRDIKLIETMPFFEFKARILADIRSDIENEQKV